VYGYCDITSIPLDQNWAATVTLKGSKLMPESKLLDFVSIRLPQTALEGFVAIASSSSITNDTNLFLLEDVVDSQLNIPLSVYSTIKLEEGVIILEVLSFGGGGVLLRASVAGNLVSILREKAARHSRIEDQVLKLNFIQLRG
jgi:hypothetical protein